VLINLKLYFADEGDVVKPVHFDLFLLRQFLYVSPFYAPCPPQRTVDVHIRRLAGRVVHDAAGPSARQRPFQGAPLPFSSRPQCIANH